MKKVFIVIIFLWAVLLRAPEVISGNYLFGFDQGRDYLAAYNIVEQSKLTLIGSEVGAGAAGINGIFHGPGYYYLLSFMYRLFQGDPYGGLLLMFLFGVGTLACTFLTVKKMFGFATAAMSLLLVGISPLIVSQSRFLWNHHASSFFIVLALYAAYNIPKKPLLYAPLSLFIAGFIYHFELAIAVPMVLAIFLSLPIVFRLRDPRVYFYSIVSIVFSFFPFFLFEWRHGWQAVTSIFTYMQKGGGGEISWFGLVGHLQNYLDNARNSFIYGNGYIGERFFNIMAVGVFIALVWFARKEKKTAYMKFFQFLLLLVFVSYMLFLFLNNQVWDYYLIHLHFVYLYVCAYWFIAKGGRVFLSVFLLLMLWSTGMRMVNNLRYDLYDFGGIEKIEGKKMAIDYMYSDAKGEPFSAFTFVPPIYTYSYDYLFKTYAKEKYGFVPGIEKKGLVYLLIEEDHSKPWTYKGWLETVIVGGDIIKTTTLSTGHLLQVRRFP